MSDYDSTATQEATISSNLNAGMLTYFLWGAYTILYAGTVYIYRSNKAAHLNRRIILCAITILYALCFAVFTIQWYFIDLAIVTDGDTRESIFVSILEGGPVWISALYQSLAFMVFIVSDALLIWRCYHVWGMSTRIILIPSVFFAAEFALFVAVVVDSALISNITSQSQATLSNAIQSAQIFMSLSTTVITTALIAYRIRSTLKLSRTSAKGFFSHVVEIIVESAAVYSIVVLVYAIITVVVQYPQVGSFVAIAGAYLQSIITIVGGMAPTVLVARIALTSPQTDVATTVTHISGLQFGSGQVGSEAVIHNVDEYVAWDLEAGQKSRI